MLARRQAPVIRRGMRKEPRPADPDRRGLLSAQEARPMSDTAQNPGAPSWQLPSRLAVGDVVTARVRRAILEQEIRPGTRLRQTQLADALGVSRMPVRDAIQELATEGLLHALPTGGVMVPPFEIGDVLDALTLRGPLETE